MRFNKNPVAIVVNGIPGFPQLRFPGFRATHPELEALLQIFKLPMGVNAGAWPFAWEPGTQLLHARICEAARWEHCGASHRLSIMPSQASGYSIRSVRLQSTRSIFAQLLPCWGILRESSRQQAWLLGLAVLAAQLSVRSHSKQDRMHKIQICHILL